MLASARARRRVGASGKESARSRDAATPPLHAAQSPALVRAAAGGRGRIDHLEEEQDWEGRGGDGHTHVCVSVGFPQNTPPAASLSLPLSLSPALAPANTPPPVKTTPIGALASEASNFLRIGRVAAPDWARAGAEGVEKAPAKNTAFNSLWSTEPKRGVGWRGARATKGGPIVILTTKCVKWELGFGVDRKEARCVFVLPRPQAEFFSSAAGDGR